MDRAALPAAAALAAALLAPAPLPAQPATYTATRDVEYARVDGTSLKLDLYVPDGEGPFPLVVWVHGGGWQSGDKGLSPSGAQVRQATRGYVVASIDYRLSGQAVFPAQSHDCKGALRWLRANASRFRIDPERVAVWGGSAGGHLVALLGTSGGVADLEGSVGGNGEYSSRVSAVVDWYGPSDLTTIDAQALPCSTLDGSLASAPHNKLIGCVNATCPEAARRASPVSYVSADDPPFFVVHGTNDCVVPPLQSQELHDALVAAGVPSTLTFLQGAGHGGAVFTDATYLPRLEAFLDARLKTPAATHAWLLPSSARSPGAGGAFFTTDLTVANTGASEAAYSVAFLGHDRDGRDGPERSFSLAPGRSVTYADLLGSVFGVSEDWGAVRVTSASASLVVAGQTSSPGGGGTYGQGVPTFADGDLVRAGSPRSIPAVREDAAFRTNLVVANATEDPIDVDVTLVGADGATLGTARLPLPPLGMTQLGNVARVLGVAGDVRGARLVLATPTAGGAFAAYAALIDNATQDPRTLLPR